MDQNHSGAHLLSAAYVRTRPLADDTGDRQIPEERFTEALNRFSFALCRVCLGAPSDEGSLPLLRKRRRPAPPEKKKNGLLSPLSAAVCLSLAENGAAGNTLAEMEKMFGLELSEWRGALSELTDLLSGETEAGRLLSANSLWVKDTFSACVRPDFLQTNADLFDAQIFSSSFDRTLPKDINDWVCDKTDGMIPKLADESNAPVPEAVLYLLNALFFDMPWKRPVSAFQIEKEPFRNADGSRHDVDMMTFPEGGYLKNGTAIGFEKRYADSRYGFVALLPTGKHTPDDVIASLDETSWKELLASYKKADVTCVMPEFSFESGYDLKAPLTALGMPSAFLNSADFSAMAESDLPLSIGKVIQKTRIEVTGSGTRAAAATMAEMVLGCAMPMKNERIEIRLDRPFVFLIVHRPSGIPLFIGTVNEL